MAYAAFYIYVPIHPINIEVAQTNTIQHYVIHLHTYIEDIMENIQRGNHHNTFAGPRTYSHAHGEPMSRMLILEFCLLAKSVERKCSSV